MLMVGPADVFPSAQLFLERSALVCNTPDACAVAGVLQANCCIVHVFLVQPNVLVRLAVAHWKLQLAGPPSACPWTCVWDRVVSCRPPSQDALQGTRTAHHRLGWQGRQLGHDRVQRGTRVVVFAELPSLLFVSPDALESCLGRSGAHFRHYTSWFWLPGTSSHHLPVPCSARGLAVGCCHQLHYCSRAPVTAGGD